MTREQAIRELKIQFIGEYDRQREAFDMAIKALEQEPRKGHWVWVFDETPSTPNSPYEVNYAGWVCSYCHKFPDDICEWDNPDEPPTYKFCPNCGSDNREVEV